MRIVLALVLTAVVSATATAGTELPKSIKDPYITLTAKVCLKSGADCEEVLLTDSDVADMAPQPLMFEPGTNKVTMWAVVPPSIKECQVHGAHTVLENFRKKGKDPDRYEVKSWQCLLGNRKPPAENPA